MYMSIHTTHSANSIETTHMAKEIQQFKILSLILQLNTQLSIEYL